MEINWIGRNRKAIAPLRVSSSGQEGNTSWFTQKRECEEYCKRHGLELIEAVAIVETARKSELRKKYKTAISKALKNGVQHILFHKYDREARNLTDNEQNEDLVRQGKVVLHYIADNKILHAGSPDSEFFNRDIQAAINKNYSRDLSTKVRKSHRAKAESGWWPGCRPPDGYIQQKPKNEKGFERRRGSVIVPDTNIQVVRRVQREFEIRAEVPTPSLKEIRNRIIAEGLIPQDQVHKYHPSLVEKHLKNIFYDGRFEWLGVEYEGKHERIITSELFWKVQETFGKKNNFRKNPNALFGHGYMKCADASCGCSIIFDPKEKTIKETGEVKTYKYYRCSNGKRVHQSLKGLSVTEESIMSQFGKAVSEISIQQDFRDELMKAVNETLHKTRRAVKDDLDRYEAALVDLQAREDLTYNHFASGIIDQDTYCHQRNLSKNKRMEYMSLMKQAQLQINEAAGETIESIIELATNAESLWNHMTTQERRELLDKLLSNRWLNGVTVEYEIVKPLRTLAEMKENQKWRILRIRHHFTSLDDFVANV